jgi:hypothetical protein
MTVIKAVIILLLAFVPVQIGSSHTQGKHHETAQTRRY